MNPRSHAATDGDSAGAEPAAVHRSARVPGVPGVAKRLRVGAVVVFAAAYPFLVAGGLAHTSARSLGAVFLVLTAVVVAAAAFGRPRSSQVFDLVVRRFGVLIAVSAAAAATDHPLMLKMLPAFSNVWLLAVFASSLRSRLSVVEQFAIAMHDRFPDFLLPYCRRVTMIWCVFFACNAAAGAVLAVTASHATWAFYTGFASYVLVALLGAGEYVFHKSRFRFYESGFADGVWRRMLPPERTALGRRTLDWQKKQTVPLGGPR
jgi:uncharacterized membrane protein